MGGWIDGLVGVKAVLRIAYSNQKHIFVISQNGPFLLNYF
jgi:hypothetical protein